VKRYLRSAPDLQVLPAPGRPRIHAHACQRQTCLAISITQQSTAMLLMTKSFKVVKGTAVSGAEGRKMTSLYDDDVLLIRPVEPRGLEPPAAYAGETPIRAVGTWSDEEDAMLLAVVKDRGPSKWSSIASRVPGRSGKQCRERWHNHLNPSIFKGEWLPEEDASILESFLEHGSSWAAFSLRMSGRTDNAIKNRFNSHIKRALVSLDNTGKSVVVRLGESSFSPTSPKASSRKKKIVDSPVTDLQNSRKKKKTKHTHIPVDVTFDFGDHYDACNDDALGMEAVLPFDVGSVLAQIVDMNDGSETAAPLCLTEAVDHETAEKRGAKVKCNLAARFNPIEDEQEDWRIMSVIAGFSTEDEEEEVKKTSGGITFRTVEVVSKIPTAHKRFVSTPFDTIMDPMKKTDMPAFQFVNKMMMTPPKNTSRSTL
tara:strand:- start:3314 stop:4591 length:1278 start_codon:yes stop_codon:yes gene_type:complete